MIQLTVLDFRRKVEVILPCGGPLQDKIFEAETGAALLEVFAQLKRATDAYQKAKALEQKEFGNQGGWKEADKLLAELGLTREEAEILLTESTRLFAP